MCRWLRLSVVLPLMMFPVVALGEVSDCTERLSASSTANNHRPLVANDLIELRDIGPAVPDERETEVIGVSPDGKEIAFQQRRANAESNSYCLGMFVVAIDGSSAPRPVDQGGEFIRTLTVNQGLTDMQTGNALPIRPKWSPDGQWIAFLRRDNGITQVWRALKSGNESSPITRLPFSVEEFAWSEDGHSIIVAGRPALAAAHEKIAEEGKVGYLYDDRFGPLASDRPFVPQPVKTEYFRVSVETGMALPLTNGEDLIDPQAVSNRPNNSQYFVRGPNGSIAWLAPALDPRDSLSSVLDASVGGHNFTCSDARCDRVVKVWWTKNGTELVYQQREGWARGQTAFYRWDMNAHPVRLLITDDLLFGCQAINDNELACAREGSIVPRQLIAIDLKSGKQRVLFDPNPEFKSIVLGSVQRLQWKNSFGLEAFGDLVLPPFHRPGQRHPLIIVQYTTRGFLRGGTGDEYPIQLYAAHGYAVLSVQRPVNYGSTKGATTDAEVDRLSRQDWADRRSVLSSIEVGTHMAVEEGVVDQSKIGITGVSDGSTTVQFALINSNLFKAAAVSNCCEDRVGAVTLLGPTFGRMMRHIGYPSLTDNGGDFWKPYSIVLNASKIETPLLIQVGDTRYLYALEAFTALREQNKPVEMYVFPAEYHLKWQPAHRLAIYERSLDWFNFWLENIESSDPTKIQQYERWRALRLARADMGATPGP